MHDAARPRAAARGTAVGASARGSTSHGGRCVCARQHVRAADLGVRLRLPICLSASTALSLPLA
eukprot:scaffold257167_cov41-Tisochrysis_lutea.AAC.1